jgi:hypothetical protein
MLARTLMLAVLAVLIATVPGCTSPESCSEGLSCDKGGSVQACCTDKQCRYKCSDGTVFKCNGTKCNTGDPSAAQRAATWCDSH